MKLTKKQKKFGLIIGAIILGVYLLNNGSSKGFVGAINPTCGSLESTLELAGRDYYLVNTLLPNEFARVITQCGTQVVDRGQVSLDQGSVLVNDGALARIYFGQTSDEYYVDQEAFTYPYQEVVHRLGKMCKIDTNPTITVFDEFDRPNTAQVIGANEVKTLKVRIRANVDKCYGNPEPLCEYNELFIGWDSNQIVDVSVPSATQTLPLTTLTMGGKSVSGKGWAVSKVKDLEQVSYDVVVTAGDVSPSHDIYVGFKDCAFSLNENGLSEIWGFEDAQGNVIGASPVESVWEIECVDGQPTTNFVCGDGTEVGWCTCSGGQETCVTSPENQCAVACAQDAKLCSDGSYVGRVAPSCDFAACPSDSTNGGGDSKDNTKLYLIIGGIVFLIILLFMIKK